MFNGKISMWGGVSPKEPELITEGWRGAYRWRGEALQGMWVQVWRGKENTAVWKDIPRVAADAPNGDES